MSWKLHVNNICEYFSSILRIVSDECRKKLASIVCSFIFVLILSIFDVIQKQNGETIIHGKSLFAFCIAYSANSVVISHEQLEHHLN